MSKWEHKGAGYRVKSGTRTAAIIRKASRFQWFGGASELTDSSVPLHGPYLFKWMAKMEAKTLRRNLIEELYWEEHGLRVTDALD